MHLVALEVKGLKSLRDTRVEGLGRYNVFIGKNDSGKSTILQAVRLLGTVRKALGVEEAAEIVVDRSLRERTAVSATFRLSDEELGGLPGLSKWRGNPAIERVGCWRYDFEMRLGDVRWSAPQLYLIRCEVVRDGEAATVLEVDNPDAPQAGYRVLATEHLGDAIPGAEGAPIRGRLYPAWKEKATGAPGPPIKAGSSSSGELPYVTLLRGFVERLQYINAVRQAPDEMAISATRELEASGSNLPQVVETLHSTYPDEFGEVETLVRRLFPDIRAIYTPTEGARKVIRVSSGVKLRPLESFRLSHVGVGVQQALMVATAVVGAQRGSVILLEEPENNLHPGAQRLLADWLQEHAARNHKQLLITTHSTIFSSTADRCRTYLARLDDRQGTKVTNVQAADQSLVKLELGIRSVDLYGYNGVVLWEGESEAQAMPLLLDVLAEKAGTSVHALGLTSRNLGGQTNVRLQAVRQFLVLLRGLDVAPYVVMDDDEGVREELDKLVRDGLLPEGHHHVWEEGRKMHGRPPGVACEFEDNFSNQQLTQAARSVAQDAGVTVELDPEEFARRCTESGSKTSDVLCKYYHELANYGLSKPDLARKVAELVLPELRGKAERTVEKYEFEKVAHDIFRKLGGLNVESTSDVGRQE